MNAIDGQVGPIEAVGPMVFSENFVNSAQADLSVVKSASPNPVVAGNQLTYTFTTSNNGPSGDTGVVLSDTLPAGEQYVSSTSSQGTVTNNNGTLSVQLGSLASGAIATTSVVVMVSAGATGSITNTVTVTGNELDPNLSNNTSTVTTQVVQSADLALVKTASPNPVKAGQQLTYTLTATNNGPSNATGVTIVDTLPPGTAYNSASGQSSATIAGQTLTLNIGNLAAAPSSTITVVVAVASTAYGHDHQHGHGQRQPTRSQPGQQHGLGHDQVDVPVDSAIVPGPEDRQDGDAQSGDRRLGPDLYAGRDQRLAHARPRA